MLPPILARLELLRKLICARAKRVSKRWDDLFDKLIDEHECSTRPSRDQQEQTTADFIHVLLSVQKEYGLTRDNVKAILLNMFEAGIETSFLVLEHAMAELMTNRDRHVKTKLQTEVRRCTPAAMIVEEDLNNLAYLKAVVKETLRLHPAVPLLVPHLSTADSEISGRDPALWESPEEFMPERFLEGGREAAVDMKGKHFQFVPFGSGRRICPGMNFSIATVEIIYASKSYVPFRLGASKRDGRC